MAGSRGQRTVRKVRSIGNMGVYNDVPWSAPMVASDADVHR